MNALDTRNVEVAATPAGEDGFCLATYGDSSELETLFGGSARCVQLTPGRFRAEVATLRIGAITVSELTCNRGMHLHASLPVSELLMACVAHGNALWEHGRPWVHPEVLLAWGGRLDLSSLSPVDAIWIEIDLSRLTPAEEISMGLHAEGSTFIAAGDCEEYDHLWAYLGVLLRESFGRGPALFDFDARKRAQSRLILLARQALQTTQLHHIDTKATRQRFSLVERVVQYMWENVEEPLTLERICAEMNCRMRSLIYSFKNTVGIGPMTYLKILRLNAARQRLKSVGSSKRIFDVAADFGFWHMGHFSSDYKRLFGTTASQTIASASEPAGTVAVR